MHYSNITCILKRFENVDLRIVLIRNVQILRVIRNVRIVGRNVRIVTQGVRRVIRNVRIVTQEHRISHTQCAKITLLV